METHKEVVRVSAARRYEVYRYLNTPLVDRTESEAEFRKRVRLTPRTWRILKNDHTLASELDRREDDVVWDASGGNEDVAKILRNLLDLSERNALAGKIYLQATGRFTEKTEATVKTFTADDFIRAGQELNRRQREEYESGGICPVCGRPQTLLEEPCLDSNEEQTTQENQVVGLGVSS